VHGQLRHEPRGLVGLAEDHQLRLVLFPDPLELQRELHPPGHVHGLGLLSRAVDIRGVAIALPVALALGLLAKRDIDQQRRVDALAREIAALRVDLDSRSGGQAPPPLAALLGRSVCSLDSASLDAISATVARASRSATARDVDADDAAAPAPRPEEEAALARARELVDRTLSRGRLSVADFMAIRAAFSAANRPDAVSELRQRIVVAINDGSLVPDDRHRLVP
jgi:hypothetical protein